MTRIKFIAILLILLPASVLSQSYGFAASYTNLGFGARAMGFGNALSSTALEGAYPYYNPALSASVFEIENELSTAMMSYDRELYHALINFPLPPDAGISVSIINATVKKIDLRTQSGYHNGFTDTDDIEVITSFGLRATKSIHVGIGFKFIYADYHPEVEPAFGFGLDIGTIVKLTNSFQASFAIQDIIKSLRWNTNKLYGTSNSDTEVNHLPARYKLGLSYTGLENKLLIAADYEVWSWKSQTKTRQTNFLYGSTESFTKKDITTGSSGLKLGIRYAVHPYFSLRSGYQIKDVNSIADSDALSLGFSIYFPSDKNKPAAHYAFVQEPNGFSNYHVISFSFSL